MSTEVITFCFFFAISVIAHCIANKAEEHQRRCGGPCWFKRSHANAITATALALAHPAVWAAVRDYVIHFTLYSGYVITHTR